MTLKWPKNNQKMTQIGHKKWPEYDTNMIVKWRKYDLKITHKWLKSD